MSRPPGRLPRAPWPAPLAAACALALAAAGALPSPALAGPPYVTDDPEPVEFRHWEVYLATIDQWTRQDGFTGTAPHVEVNYGPVPDVQLHVIAPLAWASPPGGGGAQYGYGDTELGMKLRFVREGDWTPQVGTFPLVEVPTGDASRGLGSGQTQVFLPLWVQKSFGPWTTYGGGGYWLNPGTGNRNWWYVGWLVQRQVARGLSIGAEVFHGSSRQEGRPGDTRFDVGMVLDVSELHHVLFSAGRAFDTAAAQAYLAWQLTFSPAEPGEERASP